MSTRSLNFQIAASPEFLAPLKDLELLVKQRSELMQYYRVNGYARFKAKVKSRNGWEKLTSNEHFRFVAENFSNVVEGMFFIYYLISEQTAILYRDYREEPAVFFNKVFKGCVTFESFEDTVIYSIMIVQDEVFIFRFDLLGQDVEFSFLVPFFQFRAVDKHLPDYKLYPGAVAPSKLFLVGLDKVQPFDPIVTLRLICLEDITVRLEVHNLSLDTSYSVPSVKFGPEDVCRTKRLRFVVKESGMHEVRLLKENFDKSTIPVLLHRKTFKLHNSKYVALPEYYTE